jgi:hypothetical protein
MGDLVNYYIDRIANESNISTATQRQSILNIAKTYGYIPTGYRSAITSISFTNTSADAITIPGGTQVYADVSIGDAVEQVIFTTQNDLTLLAGEADTVTSLQYESIAERAENQHTDLNGETLGRSNGLPDQQFTLAVNQVVDGSVRIFVKNGDVFEEWTKAVNLIDYGPVDLVFSTTTDSNNFVCITFGDGVSGYIPPKDSIVRAVYYVGGGTMGNVAVNTQFFVNKYPSGTLQGDIDALDLAIDSSNIKNTVAAAFGGSDPESDASIRKNAPLLLSSFNRAVTLQDYANLSLGITSVGKANAQSDIWSSVNVYIAPDSSSDPYPGYSTTDLDAVPLSEDVLTPAWLSSKSDVIAYLSDKTQIGVTATILPPTYSRVAISIQYTAMPGYTEEKVTGNIRANLFSLYSYANLSFADVITPEEIEANLRYVDGVLSVKVTSLGRLGDAAGRHTLVGAANEIFTFENDNTSITLLSSVASLSNITSAAGSISPTFVSNFYNYNFVTSTNTTQLTVSSSSGGTIYANGAAQSSGVAFTVNTPSGVTTVPVVVTAADGIAKATYTVTFTH